MEVMPDHVHLFGQAAHTTVPVEIAKTLTSISAVVVFTRFPTLKGQRFWGSGLWSERTYYYWERGLHLRGGRARLHRVAEATGVGAIHPRPRGAGYSARFS